MAQKKPEINCLILDEFVDVAQRNVKMRELGSKPTTTHPILKNESSRDAKARKAFKNRKVS